MATQTASYNFLLPTVGGDASDWGTFLNANWEALDNLLNGTAALDGPQILNATLSAVELTGTNSFDNMPTFTGDAILSGNITLGATNAASMAVSGNLTVGGDSTLGGTTQVNDLIVLGSFSFNGAATFGGFVAFQDAVSFNDPTTFNDAVDVNADVDGTGGNTLTFTNIFATEDLVVGGNGRFRLPSGNSAARPDVPTVGDVRYNTQLGYAEFYTAQGWQPPYPVLLNDITSAIPVDLLTIGENLDGWDHLRLNFTIDYTGQPEMKLQMSTGGSSGSTFLAAGDYDSRLTSPNNLSVNARDDGIYFNRDASSSRIECHSCDIRNLDMSLPTHVGGVMSLGSLGTWSFGGRTAAAARHRALRLINNAGGAGDSFSVTKLQLWGISKISN